MTNNSELSRLVTLISEFEKLDVLLLKSIEKGNMAEVADILGQTLSKKKEIKRFLSKRQPLSVNSSLGLKLKKIRDNYGYEIDGVLYALTKISGKSFSQESEEDSDSDEDFFTVGADEHVVEGYYTRKNEVGTLIVNESLPEHFVHHFQNLRDCYALALFQATIIYCRAVIETGCFEALRRKGKVRLDPKVEDFREFNLKSLMNSIKHFVYGENWDKADKVIKKANGILHSKIEKTNVTQTDAYNAIKDTFAIVEELFSAGIYKNKQRR
jgi:hypothetical protein